MQILHAIDINPEQYVAEEYEKRIRPPTRCPHCQRFKTLRALGYYVRSLSRLEAGALSLLVRRFRCCACGKTVSRLPAFAEPYRFVKNQTIEYFARGTPFSDEVRVIGHVGHSLEKVIMADGKIDNYKFAVDPKQLVPTLTISGVNNRSFSWDPVSKLILTDGDWFYKITPGIKLFVNAQIERTKINAPNQKEFYYDDVYQGIITAQGIDGVRQITQLFVGAGPLKGRVRSVTQVKNGVSTILRKYDYDETGKMIREVLNGKIPHNYTFKYDARGKQIEVDQDGKLFMKKDFDAQGRLICKTFSSGIKETYSYLANCVQQTTYFRNGETRVAQLPIIFGTMQQEATSSLQSASLSSNLSTDPQK